MFWSKIIICLLMCLITENEITVNEDKNMYANAKMGVYFVSGQ